MRIVCTNLELLHTNGQIHSIKALRRFLRNTDKKNFLSKYDSAQRCDRTHTRLMTCKTHSYRKAASSSEILVLICQTVRFSTSK